MLRTRAKSDNRQIKTQSTKPRSEEQKQQMEASLQDRNRMQHCRNATDRAQRRGERVLTSGPKGNLPGVARNRMGENSLGTKQLQLAIQPHHLAAFEGHDSKLCL